MSSLLKQSAEEPYTQQTPLLRKLSIEPTQNSFSIALVTPCYQSNTLFLQEGIEKRLKESYLSSYTLHIFAGQNNRVSIADACSKSFYTHDVLITHGITCTTIARDLLQGSEFLTPLIFSGIFPHHLDYLKDQQRIIPLTGVVRHPNYTLPLNRLRYLKKELHSILILFKPYDTQAEIQVQEYQKMCSSYGITLFPFPVGYEGNLIQQISSLNITFDTIFLLPRTLTAPRIQQLVNYCNKESITLCCFDKDTLNMGAAIAFYGHELQEGIHIARLIMNILEVHRSYEQDMIIDYVEHYITGINKQTAHLQGIETMEQMTAALEYQKKVPGTVQRIGMEL